MPASGERESLKSFFIETVTDASRSNAMSVGTATAHSKGATADCACLVGLHHGG